MAVLASIATGNFLTAGTWGLVDATSYLNAENGSEILTTAYTGTRSSTFTPGAIVVSHIGVKLSVRTGTTGTISVELYNSTGAAAVAGTEVTINTADLPVAATSDANGGWIFFKLASPVTLIAATAYAVEAKTSSASQVSLFRNATADNLARALITTTTQAPVAGDDMIVAGEYTGAGTSNSFTVTNDNTATTDFGSNTTSLITPAMAVCSKGTLSYGTTAATNYYLKLSGNLVIYSGGTFNIGTTGTPIPRDSTAVLEFDPAADGVMGVTPRNLGTFVSQGLSRTSGKNIIACKLNTDEAAAQTTLGVDTDTGWLASDDIVIASTSRTASETEKRILNANAGASSIVVTVGLTNAHSGTSPNQAEVVLLTRNVKIRSATSTFMIFINPKATSTVDIDWTEMRYFGENATNVRGIEIATTTGSFNMHYSSLYDCEDQALYISSASGSNITIGNNVFYNMVTSATNINGITFSASSGVSTIDSNYFITMGGISSPAMILFSDLGITFTNNTMAGNNSGGQAIDLNETSGILGTFSGNTIHSCSGFGIRFIAILNGTFTNTVIRRCSSYGITMSANIAGKIIFDTLDMTGNANGILMGNNYAYLVFKNLTVAGDASFASGAGISKSSGGIYQGIYILNSSFGVGTAHTTADISLATNATTPTVITLINTTLASSTEVQNITTGLTQAGYMRFQKHDGSLNTTKSIYQQGTISADQTTRHTASGHSWKMTPTSATNKLIFPGPSEFDTLKAAVNASSLVTIKVWVYEDGSYNGNRARLVLVGGIIGGIASDVVATATAASDAAWEELTVTGTPNEAGVVEFYVDCDGTAGNLYVDDVTITQ